MALDYSRLLSDLEAESNHLIYVLDEMSDKDWDVDTPANGWTVRDQISHLAFFDESAVSAMLAPDTFRANAAELMADGMDFPDRIALRYATTPGRELLAWFRRTRTELINALDRTDPRARMPWFGPNMSIASNATARLMETWAHGRDVYDALGAVHPDSSGLRSIAHLGVSTFAFAHTLNGLEVPSTPVRVELESPSGAETWTWGPEDADDSVVGPAEHFALAVTQRRHVDDTSLTITGEVARSWMKIAQAFAGTPGQGRSPQNLTVAKQGG